MKEQPVYVYGHQIGLPMLIHVSRVRSHTASRVTWHSHEGFELLFLLDGATTYELAGKKFVELTGGHFLVLPPRLVHRGLHGMRLPSTICGLAFKAAPVSGWRNSTFTKTDLSRLQNMLAKADRMAHPFGPALRWLVRQIMEETAKFPESANRAEAGIALRSLICAALVECMRQLQVPRTEPKQFVAAAVAYLREHLAEPVRMDALVQHLGFSRARVFDMFRAQTGLTPNDYLQRLRVEKAQELLGQTQLSVTDIAMTTGFSSGQYFSTVFSRYTGVSPSAFRTGARTRTALQPVHALDHVARGREKQKAESL
jgi:AraC-like DNA-binding protein